MMFQRFRVIAWFFVPLLLVNLQICSAFSNFLSRRTDVRNHGRLRDTQGLSQRFWLSSLGMKSLSREDEIRRKIVQLKKDGKIKDSSSSSASTSLSSYRKKVNDKLGKTKSRLLGIESSDDDDGIDAVQAELDKMDDDDEVQGRIGSVPGMQQENAAKEAPVSLASNTDVLQSSQSDPTSSSSKSLINPSLFQGQTNEPEMSEEDLVDLVERTLLEKRRKEVQGRNEAAEPRIATTNAASSVPVTSSDAVSSSTTDKQFATSGVGGKWIKDDNTTASTEYYQPKTGSWGAFPRPKDISKAYGGGRRVGVGYSNEDKAASELATKELLQRYREKVGIDVPSEKEHATEIEEALNIGQLAMQRGVYATAVSALEKVTPWCSTNSKVGSKVFLELAMAYEAVGRNQEAYQVYQTLSKCRMEDVKYNAKRLLYGMEAMEFMRDVSADFSRKKIRNTFIDTTGLANIAQNFDDVYQTAYIDLEGGFYKRLTESVVRSNREARQILLKATGKGEIGRMRIVQALRSIARHFDDALEMEQAAARKAQPTAMMNGKPILGAEAEVQQGSVTNMDEFVLSSPDQMISNLNGKWRLQLLADKKGDGVSFFNTTQAMQTFSVESMTFTASGRSGFLKIDQSGEIGWDSGSRILSREKVKSSGASTGFLGMFGDKQGGFAGAVSRQQQIMTVDSILLVTKCPFRKGSNSDDGKEYFAVWRREGKQVA